MNQDISGSKLVTFQFSGHGLIWEEQDKFNEELANFIG
jgi:non-heme chloroperoxidase